LKKPSRKAILTALNLKIGNQLQRKQRRKIRMLRKRDLKPLLLKTSPSKILFLKSIISVSSMNSKATS
jgi:hypothetical protein